MRKNKFDLSNKSALITGAGGLLGGKHAEALLENNANVILTDINKLSLESLKKNLSNNFPEKKISFYLMDITKTESINEVSKKILSNRERVDILINNAAIDPKVTKDANLQNSTRLENFPLEEWNKQINVGLSGAFLCTKIFGSLMAMDDKGGVIVNIASDLSVIAPDQRLYFDKNLNPSEQSVKPITYSVIKSGIIGLTKYISTYWADKGIRCNALSPGGIFNYQNKEFIERVSKLIPLGRMANVDEYKSAIQFLCSDASSYMNGHNLILDGGRSVW